MKRLRRWARAQLPYRARGYLDTDDIVQDVLMQTLAHLETFEPEHQGAFRAYLRQALKRRLIDETRHVRRTPGADRSAGGIMDLGPSPLEEVIGREMMGRYERAFERLALIDQAALAARLEDGASYQEIAEELGKPSADAARMTVKRALTRLAQEMAIGDA